MSKFIPFVIHPLPDELLYSWVLRLAKANCMSPKTFYKTYFGKNNMQGTYYVPVDIRKGFLNFYDALRTKQDAAELYLQMSTLGFETLSWSLRAQTQLVNVVFRPINQFYQGRNPLFSNFHMCPECIKEDIKKHGEAYIHRSHQLTGVTICHKHHCALHLIKLNCASEYDFVNMEFDKPLTTNVTKAEIDYAKYTHILLTRNVLSNVNILHQIVVDNLVRLNNGENIIYNTIPRRIKELFKWKTITPRWQFSYMTLKVQEIVLILMHFYPDANELIEALPKYNLILKKHCDICNKDYYITQEGLDDGWGCIYCDAKLDSYEMFKKKYPNFELIEFNGSGSPAKIKHNICGNVFDRPCFRDFTESGRCPLCEITITTTEGYKQQVFDLVGDEYTVLGDITNLDEKIPIRHNKCGNTYNYKGINFLTGSRCEHCVSNVHISHLKDMLAQYAGGRYVLIKSGRHYHTILDTKNNKELSLRSVHIVQELTRVTPSTLLPSDSEPIQRLNTWDRWYQLLIEYKEEHGHLLIGHREHYKGKAIHDFVTRIRIQYNQGTLDPEKKKLLEDIGFIFDPIQYLWEQRFEEYKEYVRDTGDYFPRIDCVYKGHKIGSWFKGQRHENHRGKLNPKRKQLLLKFNPHMFDSVDIHKQRKKSKEIYTP